MVLKSLDYLKTKKESRTLKILLIVLGILTFTAIAYKIGDYIYCHTVAICDHARPPLSTKMLAEQYEYALRDMDEGRYESAKQRLEFIIFHDPQYLGATEKLLEVEKILSVQSTP